MDNMLKGWIRGWRHIAQYLDCSVSTAKRLHYRYYLPILRLPGGTPVLLPPMADMWLTEFNRLKKEDQEKEREEDKEEPKAEDEPEAGTSEGAEPDDKPPPTA